MHLTLVGLSHKTAPVEIREKLTFPANSQEDALARLTRIRRRCRGRDRLDVQPHRDLRGHCAGCRRPRRGHRLHGRLPRPRSPRARALPLHLRGRSGRHATCSAWSHRSTRWCWARRRSSARSKRPTTTPSTAARAGGSSTSCSARASRSASACAPRPRSARTPSRSATRRSSSPRRSSTRSTAATVLVLGAGKMSELTAKHLVCQRRAPRARREPHLRARRGACRQVRRRADPLRRPVRAHERGRHRHLARRRRRTT